MVKRTRRRVRARQAAVFVAFIELRGRLLRTTSNDFADGDTERAEALGKTEHDYTALVEVGAEAARLQAELAASDRQATAREVDTAALLLTRMSELAGGVKARIPRGL